MAADVPRFLLDLRNPTKAMLEPRQQHGFGSVYRPGDGDASDYYDAVLGGQYDAWVWLDETWALRPLPATGAPPHHLHIASTRSE